MNLNRTTRSDAVRISNPLYRRCSLGGVLCAAWLMCAAQLLAGGFVYETPAEFVTTGDFDGDGLTDVVVVDRATGNARVGYQTPAGAIDWLAATPTGVPKPTAIAAGRFFVSGREALAVTSPEFNRIKLLELSPGTNRSTFAPNGVGPNLLIGLRNPQGAVDTPPLDWVAAGSRSSDPGITILDLFGFLGDGAFFLGGSNPAQTYLDKGNSLLLSGMTASLGAVMHRGSNDTFGIYSFTNANQFALGRPNLAAGTDYVFGRFNNESQPRFLFYVPGQSNVIVQSLMTNGSVLGFGPAVVTGFTGAVQRVFYVDEGSNGLAMIQFGSGIVGERVSAGGALLEAYRFGAGTGFTASAVVSLGNTRFALLSAQTNEIGSARSETFERSGTNYNLISSSNLPPKTTKGTRANVWLFAGEPFVNSQPGFVSSLNGGDWVASLTGLPGAIDVVAETDRGIDPGLGNPVSTPLGASPGGTTHGIVNQYHSAISLFSYASTRAAEPIRVSISPPPGEYASSVQVSFTTAPAGSVFYYTGSGSYQAYSAPFTVGTNTTIQFYGVNTGTSQRGSLQTASYTIIGGGTPSLVTTNGVGTNGVPQPPLPNVTNGIPAYAYGTVLYSRRTGTNGAIWSITVDGAGDRYITEGTRPRLSPEGRYLAFLRGGYPFDTIPSNNGDIWIRDLLTGAEWRLVQHTNLIVGFDWEYGNTNLVFDHGCGLFRVDIDGHVSQLPFATLCPEDAPAVNPIDGRIAFHSVAALQTNYGIFVTDPGVTMKQYLNLPLLKPRRPAWSSDGEQLALSDYAFTYLPESPMNLYVVNPDGTELFQITGFTQIEGFREGALWTPNSDGLIGAARIGGVNGIWLVPLTPDRHACGSQPVRLPTTPGDDIDFVGSIFVPPPPPRLIIRRELNQVVVSWRRTAWPYALESTSDLNIPWFTVPGPFTITNRNFEHRIPSPAITGPAFFRLKR